MLLRVITVLHCVLMKWQHAQVAASSSPWLTWTGRAGVARVWLPSGSGEREEAIMGLFRRPKHTARTNRKPTLRERRAAERTARAEASLVETEQKIHQIADDVRSDIKGSA
jgi:hypothetical protein